ncbi:MAG: hypothetical protein R2856_09620 [Caldilineaceae bacterium]
MFEDFCRRWGLTLDGAVMHAGLGIVAPVRRAGDRGDERCASIMWIDASTAQEALVLAVWTGAALHACSKPILPRALLLEWLIAAFTARSTR